MLNSIGANAKVGLVTLIIALLLVIACGPSTPENAPVSDPPTSVSNSYIATPSSTEASGGGPSTNNVTLSPSSPRPPEPLTAAPPTPEASTFPPQTPVPYEPGESELVDALDSLPLTFEERGLWFSNFGQALELAGAAEPGSVEELLALPEDEKQKYIRAWGGGGFGSGLIDQMRQTREWGEAFGFSNYLIDVAVATGLHYSSPLEPNFFTGDFNEDFIVGKLDGLDYRTETAAGQTYYAIRDDFAQDLKDPVGRFAMGSVNRVYVEDGVLIASPNSEPLVQILQSRNGELPTLAESPAFSSIAAELNDPLGAALLTKAAVLEPKGMPGVEYAKPADWKTLQEWQAFGAGYSKTADVTSLRFSLYYSNPESAELDAEELVKRIQAYEDADRVNQFCERWQPTATVHRTGSTLTAQCTFPNSGQSGSMGIAIMEMTAHRRLGFLVQ